MLTTDIKLIDKYDYLSENFKKAYAWLRNTDLKSLKVGKYPINGEEVYAFVQEYETQNYENIKYEAHHEFFDIQYVVEGEEFFGYYPLKDLKEIVPYNKDIEMAYYADPKEKTGVVLKKGDMAIVPPEDCHKPRCSIINDHPTKVKKIVIKVKAR